MKNDLYFFKIISNYIKKIKDKGNVNIAVQNIYNKNNYGYNDINDDRLITLLQEYNINREDPYLATGQSGYFHEQIMNNGLGNLKLNDQDREDAKFIANCFGKNVNYSANDIPITYTTLLGTTEFNYATQTFPAGIFEDVFQCSADHNLPIYPIIGESEQNFYLRLLDYQINSSNNFDMSYKQEVMKRAERLINNFCSHKNKVYLIKLSNVENIKASFGDVYGLRNGSISNEDARNKVDSLETLSQLLLSFNIDSNTLYSDPNMSSEYGVALYGNIPANKIEYIEVERKYQMVQKRAMDLGSKKGEVVNVGFNLGDISSKHM